MLTDTELKKLKPTDKAFKVSDRDGMYVSVSTTGTKSFRYDYRINGRRETLTIGRYDESLSSKATRELDELEYGISLTLGRGEVLALLSEMPVDAVRDAVASRRLYAWGLLDGDGTEGAMPSLLSGWLSATEQFAEWIEQPYASDTDLLIALCNAQVSLSASR